MGRVFQQSRQNRPAYGRCGVGLACNHHPNPQNLQKASGGADGYHNNHRGGVPAAQFRPLAGHHHNRRPFRRHVDRPPRGSQFRHNYRQHQPPAPIGIHNRRARCHRIAAFGHRGRWRYRLANIDQHPCGRRGACGCAAAHIHFPDAADKLCADGLPGRSARNGVI